jgi:hypothetical protein
MDMRLAYCPNDRFEFVVAGRNLLDAAHPEFGNDAATGTLATEVQHEVYGIVTYRY